MKNQLDNQLSLEGFETKKPKQHINMNDRMKFIVFGIEENLPGLMEYIKRQK